MVMALSLSALALNSKCITRPEGLTRSKKQNIRESQTQELSLAWVLFHGRDLCRRDCVFVFEGLATHATSL